MWQVSILLRLVNTVATARLYYMEGPFAGQFLAIRLASINAEPPGINGGMVSWKNGGYNPERGQFVWHGPSGYFDALRDWELDLIKDTLMPAYKTGKLPLLCCDDADRDRDEAVNVRAWDGLPILFMGMQRIHLPEGEGNFNSIYFGMNYGNEQFLKVAVWQIGEFARVMGVPAEGILLGRTCQYTYFENQAGDLVDPIKLVADRAGLCLHKENHERWD